MMTSPRRGDSNAGSRACPGICAPANGFVHEQAIPGEERPFQLPEGFECLTRNVRMTRKRTSAIPSERIQLSNQRGTWSGAVQGATIHRRHARAGGFAWPPKSCMVLRVAKGTARNGLPTHGPPPSRIRVPSSGGSSCRTRAATHAALPRPPAASGPPPGTGERLTMERRPTTESTITNDSDPRRATSRRHVVSLSSSCRRRIESARSAVDVDLCPLQLPEKSIYTTLVSE